MNNNPAKRLYNILDEFRGQNLDSTLVNACCELFKIDPNDQGQILYRIFGIINLIKELKERIFSLNITDKEIFLETIENLELAFLDIRSSMKMYELMSKIDKSILTGLRYCSEIILRDLENNIMAERELDNLLIEVDTLILQVIKAGLPDQAKNICINILGNILKSIIKSKKQGIKRIGESIGFNNAQDERNISGNKENADDQNEKKFFEMLKKFDSLFRVSKKIRNFISLAVEYLFNK